MNKDNILKLGRAVIETERDALDALIPRINDNFYKACEFLYACQGRVVVLGMGKSGHIGGKIAATLASTGTPAFFVHPAEASHGDLGMITRNDVVLALSNSGNTEEILTILPIIKRLNVPLIAMLGSTNSNLGKNASVVLDVSVEQEACPLNLAPTSSTTASLVMGDALAVALLETRGFTKEDFARSHPAGSLGRQLLLKVADIMHKEDELPVVSPDTLVPKMLVEMSDKLLGMVAVVDKHNKILGVFTDGDLRRTLEANPDINLLTADEVMTPNCITVEPDILAAAAVQIMDDNNINGLLVSDAQGCLLGVLNMLDLLHAKVI